jgi:hypothetical protein
MTSRDTMEEFVAHAEKVVQEAREERVKLQELIAEAHQVAQELLHASRQAKEEIRQSAKHEARKQLAGQLARITEQLRVKDA